MSTEICCVCDTPIEGTVRALGSRRFCERHYEHLTKDRKGLWLATIAFIVALLLFVLAMQVVGPMLTPALTGGRLVAAGILLAVIPASLWLGVFYLQDRVEPEPKRYVLGVALLSALLASAIGQPLINGFFRVNEWASASLLLKVIAAVFIVGAIQEALKYAAVRHTVFRSREFDERVDGIIYGSAAGLGYATMLNIQYVIGNGGVDLGIGTMRIVLAALAHASFAGVTGYFLGRAKFEAMGPLWLPAGVALAALLNGVVTVALGSISRPGLHAMPFNGVAVAALVAALTFAFLFRTLRRANQVVLSAASAPSTSAVTG
jgi:RsiW-degrading membrane proteinase PrsW (M82 family)